MAKTEELISAIQLIAKKLRDIKEKELEKIRISDFSFAGFRYLEEIAKLGTPTFVELTKQLGYSKPTVTLMIAKLIQNGLVVKEKSKTDGRVYFLSLSEKGRKIIESYDKIYSEFINKISSRFNDEELSTLVSLLKRME